MPQVARLDPKVRYVWMVGALMPAFFFAVVTAGLLTAGVPVAPWITGGLAALIATIGLVAAPARWRSWGYLLTETELIVRFGVLVKSERWLPRTRVQYVDIVGGPIERALGLRQMTIYTAGTRVADLSIPGLPVQVAESLRDELLAWSRDKASSDVDETTPHDQELVPGEPFDPDSDGRSGAAFPGSDEVAPIGPVPNPASGPSIAERTEGSDPERSATDDSPAEVPPLAPPPPWSS
jgi:uncharacterized protein